MKKTLIPILAFIAVAAIVFVSCKTVDHKNDQQSFIDKSINILSTQGDKSLKRCYSNIREGKAGMLVFYCGTCSYVPGEAVELESYGLGYCSEYDKR